MEFGKKLKMLLEFEDIQHKKFAETLNIHPSTLNGYLNEGKQPDFELVKKIADTLGVSTDYLLDHDNKPQGPPLSAAELAMLTKFRRFSKEKQDVLISLMDMLNEK